MSYNIFCIPRRSLLKLIGQTKAHNGVALCHSFVSPRCRYSSTFPTTNKIRAWQIYQYGNISELTLNQVTKLSAIESPSEILVQIHAASVNPIDLRMMGGYGQGLINVLRKRKGLSNVATEFPLTLGRDFSGTVVQVGRGVKGFKIGDEVWGAIGVERQGTHAEFTVCSENEISKKPPNISHLEAASLPYVAATIWSGLCTYGQLKKGDIQGKRVLVLGGSGGTGTFAIQMLKSWEASVTVTCSKDAIDLVTRLGADMVVDYGEQDVWSSLDMLPKFDLILDTVGDCSYQKLLHLLTPWTNSMLVILTTPLLSNSDKYGLMPGLVRSAITAGFQTLKGASSGKSVRWGIFRPNGKALCYVAQLVQDGKVTPVVHQSFSFSQVPEAFKVAADGHLRGKIVIDMISDSKNV